MKKIKDQQFDFNEQIEQPSTKVAYQRSPKVKLIKQLNNRTTQFRSDFQNYDPTSTRNRNKMILSKSRKIIKKKQQSIVSIKSQVESCIPGAKIIKGSYVQDKLNGQVIIQFQNGSKFQGIYKNGVRISGKMFYSKSNCQYQGGYFGQKFDGYGRLTFFGGRTIEGEWDNMQFIGHATITYPNQDVYYGPVDQNIYKNGQGYLFLKNGHKYIGNFKHGTISGIGSYYKQDKLLAKGLWQNGKLIKQMINDQVELMQLSSVHRQVEKKTDKNVSQKVKFAKAKFNQTTESSQSILFDKSSAKQLVDNFQQKEKFQLFKMFGKKNQKKIIKQNNNEQIFQKYF